MEQVILNMNYRIIASLLALLSLLAVKTNGATPIVQMMEGEARVGMTTPLGGFHGGKASLSASLGLEGRYNFRGTPWDCGLMLELTTARYSFNHMFDHGSDLWQSNRTLGLAFTGDYNFRQGTKINPFVGTALGVAFNDAVGDKYFPLDGTAMLFAPRVGVEFLHHIRLTAQFNISRKGCNNFNLSIGFVLGGRPKK